MSYPEHPFYQRLQREVDVLNEQAAAMRVRGIYTPCRLAVIRQTLSILSPSWGRFHEDFLKFNERQQEPFSIDEVKFKAWYDEERE